MKEKSKLAIEIIISLIVVVFSAKMIYKRINFYLYGDTVEISEVKKHCAGHLPSHKQPTDILVLQNLPLNSSGKPDRDAIKRLYSSYDCKSE